MVSRTSLSLLALAPGLFLTAQAQPPAATPAPTPAALPSATLQPSLDVLRTALTQVRLDRWKASNEVRDQTQTNVGSIQRDLQSTLPGLLTAADAAPSSAAKVLPAYRNIEALYDVLLRIDATARLSAPPDQISALDQALNHLDDSRTTLGQQIQRNSEAQEAQVVHLQAALKAVPPPTPPPPAPVVKCAAPPVLHTKKKPATTAAKSTTPPAATQNSPTPSH